MKKEIKINTKRKIILIFIFIIVFQLFFSSNITYVISDSERFEYNSRKMNYPGYRDRINILKTNHPNWKFVIMKTGLDWNEVIANEYTGHFDTPKNLIQGKSGGWICSICGSKVYDTGKWMCASESAIRYYMDPRNWLVDSPYLFQFLQTDYMETLDLDIYSALNGTFLYSMDIARTINTVCKNNNASPYFIIARILQEQGNSGGRTYKMQDVDGKIYYNLFNIGATGNTEEEVYANALAKAKQSGWTSIESCLNGGISFLLSSYISYKQNTLYLNKFDVESYQGLYDHQYMQNIEAPKNESISMYNKMKNANLLNKALTFVIPVYENMPKEASKSPDASGEIFPKNIRVKEGHYGIMVRAGRSTTSTVLDRVEDSNVNILSVERYSDGWHKIVLERGTVGYLKFNSEYLEEVDDVTNCYEQKTITQGDTILRTGPGLEHAEITNLERGERVIRIDNSGRYKFDGKIWDRIIIGDGRQGFVIRDALSNDENQKENIIEENTENVVKGDTSENTVEHNENTISKNETETENIIDQNTTENIIEENIVTDQNIIEDNIITEQNVVEENIIKNQNITEDNIIAEQNIIQENIITEQNVVEENNESQNEIIQNEIEDNNSNKSEETKYFIIKPDKQAKDLDGIVTKNGIETEEAGTGYKINIDGKEYIIVKRGDANGDGYVKANDYLIIKDYIIGKNTNLKDEYLEASDVTNDKAVKANDYLKIKDHIMYGVEI